MIVFANSDSTIWNRDQLVIDLAHAMSLRLPRIDLKANGEGPCAVSLGLYDLLDNMCSRFNYPGNQIYLTTCNLIEKHHTYNIIINPQVYYLNTAQRYTPPSTGKQIQKHFGHFIGHGNGPRLYIGSYLYRNHREKTLQTYHCDTTEKYHRPFIGLEDLMFGQHGWECVDSAIELIKAAPITSDKIDQYPILSPATFNITKLYPEFFVEVVNLTYWSGNTFYIDEKIWRPMLMRTPFIVHGPQNFLSRLQKLGFKTFGHWWDEGYGEDPEGWQLTEIPKIIDRISQMSISELESMYADMKQTVDHNFHLMKSLETQQLYV
jgi:hypothetical protein